MKKIIPILLVAVLLTAGVVSTVYANDNRQNGFGFGGSMMNDTNKTNYSETNDTDYNKMTDIMRSSGFESAAEAMENRDFGAMNDFMNNITDGDYDRMIEVMEESGYEGMASMMEAVDREVMVDMHNSMMGRW